MNKQEEQSMRQLYPSWYNGPPDPHVSITHLRGPNGEFVDRWRCSYCGMEGSYTELFMKGGCTYKHEPCKHCGHAPVCAADCTGIGAALSREDVYVAGFMDNGEH